MSQMNATFISVDGTGMELRYNVGVRNRGHGTRNGPPNNQHVAFAERSPVERPLRPQFQLPQHARPDHGQRDLSHGGHCRSRRDAGATADQRRQPGHAANMYGVYARLDAFDSFFAEQHFSDDPDGNLYSCFRDNGEADLRYLGTNPNSYRPSYFKESNASPDDWSDLIHLVDVLNNAPEATYFQDVSKVINVPQWLRYIALDSLLMNNETGLNLGIGDDYFMYRGVTDPRFVLIPHDLDTILDQGGNVNASIFSIVRGGGGYNGVDGLKRFFNHPEVIAALPRRPCWMLIDEFFNPETLDPLFDRVLGGFAPASRIDAMKQSIRQRIAAVRAQIPQKLTINSTLSRGERVSAHHRWRTTPSRERPTPAATRSVAINGKPGTWSAENGTWQSGGASGPAESLVSAGSEWKYLDDGSDQGTAWYSPGFDDSAWRSGRAELGYGDGDEATVVNSGPTSSRYITTYFRKSFTAAKVATVFHACVCGCCAMTGRWSISTAWRSAAAICRRERSTIRRCASASLGGADESTFIGL